LEYLQLKNQILEMLIKSDYKFTFENKNSNRFFYRLLRMGNSRKSNPLKFQSNEHQSNNNSINFFNEITGISDKKTNNSVLHLFEENNYILKKSTFLKNFYSIKKINILTNNNNNIEKNNKKEEKNKNKIIFIFIFIYKFIFIFIFVSFLFIFF